MQLDNFRPLGMKVKNDDTGTGRWLDHIDATTFSFRQRFGKLSETALNWKPRPEVWSIAQNIDHLITINETYFPIIASIKNKTFRLPWTGRLGLLVKFLGSAVLKAVQPDRRKKMKTFKAARPSTGKIPGDIVEKFAAHQQKLKELIASSGELLNNNTIISSPANRYIVYRLETAFDIIVAHEQRHLAQATEMLEMIPRGIN
jgi:hypothetical protein